MKLKNILYTLEHKSTTVLPIPLLRKAVGRWAQRATFPQMQRVDINRIIAVAFAIIGLLVSILTCSRIWDEGILGNDSGILFFSMYGPVVLFGVLAAGLLLTTAQVGRLLDLTNGLLLSRISFVLFVMVLALDLRRSRVWSYGIDLLVFASITVLVYLPVITRTFSTRVLPKNGGGKTSS